MKPPLIIGIISSAVVIIAALVFVSYFVERNNQPVPTVQPKPSVNPEAVLETITKKSSLTFPLPVSSSPATIDSLPKYAQSFIFPQASMVSIDKLAFENKKQGFSIKYRLLGKIFDVYRSFSVLNFDKNWKIVSGGRTNDVGYIDYQINPAQGRIVLIQDNQGLSIIITEVNN